MIYSHNNWYQKQGQTTDVQCHGQPVQKKDQACFDKLSIVLSFVDENILKDEYREYLRGLFSYFDFSLSSYWQFLVPLQYGYFEQPKNSPYLPFRNTMREPHFGQLVVLVSISLTIVETFDSL